METVELLRDLRERGVELRVAGDRVEWRPGEAVAVEVIREHKPALLPMVAVLAALEGAAHLAAAELRERTDLDDDRLYAALGALYRVGIIRTDHTSLAFWVGACRDRRCSWDGTGEVGFCALCGTASGAATERERARG